MKPHLPTPALAVGLALGLVAIFPARAADSNYDGGSWTPGPIRLVVDVSQATGATVDALTLRTAVTEAAAAWNTAIGADVIVPEFGSVSSPSLGDRKSELYFSAQITETTAFANQFAYANSDRNPLGCLAEADLIFNPAHPWTVYNGPVQLDGNSDRIPDLRRVALHEMGHILGLLHPASDDALTIMRSTMTDLETLQPIDVADARLIARKLTERNRPRITDRRLSADRQTLTLRGTAAPFIVRTLVATATSRAGTRIRTTPAGERWVLRVPLAPGANKIRLRYLSRAVSGATQAATISAGGPPG